MPSTASAELLYKIVYVYGDNLDKNLLWTIACLFIVWKSTMVVFTIVLNIIFQILWLKCGFSSCVLQVFLKA
jgi:hypothetical protein